MLSMSDGPAATGSAGGHPGWVAAQLMKHRTYLHAYLLGAVRNAHDAEDLLQEVSLAAIGSAGQVSPDANFRAWAREIARLRILKYLETSRRAPAILPPDLLDRLDDLARDREADEENVLEKRRLALADCLRTLKGPARQVLDLRYGRLWKVDRIAASIGRTLGATYTLLERARQALRRCADLRLRKSTG